MVTSLLSYLMTFIQFHVTASNGTMTAKDELQEVWKETLRTYFLRTIAAFVCRSSAKSRKTCRNTPKWLAQ
jgi:hypothetical protein